MRRLVPHEDLLAYLLDDCGEWCEYQLRASVVIPSVRRGDSLLSVGTGGVPSATLPCAEREFGVIALSMERAVEFA